MDIKTAIEVLRLHKGLTSRKMTYLQDPKKIETAIDALIQYVEDKIDTCILIGQDHDDYFVSGIVTSCCHVEPTPNKKYCPKCGAKVERDV